MIFENSQIDVRQLPAIQDIAYQRLDPAHVRVKYISTAIFFVIMLLGIVFLWRIPVIGDNSILANGLLGVWVLWAVISFWLVKRGYEIEGYALREKDIIHIKGVINRKQTAIPFNRVQHCEIKEGPIQRFFKLKTLEIYTAGGQTSDLSISGLRGEDAQQLKNYIIQTTGEEEYDEEE